MIDRPQEGRSKLPRKRKSMRKIQEILRLHFEQKLGQRQIARSANLSQSTVHGYLARMNAAGLRWPLDPEWDEDRLQQALFPPGQTAEKVPLRVQPDFVHVRQQLEQHRDLTVELWEEFLERRVKTENEPSQACGYWILTLGGSYLRIIIIRLLQRAHAPERQSLSNQSQPSKILLSPTPASTCSQSPKTSRSGFYHPSDKLESKCRVLPCRTPATESAWKLRGYPGSR